MLNLAVILFALAAVGGLILASLHFKGKDRPWTLAALHGLLGAAALAMLLVPFLNGSAPGAVKVPLILFLIAALGGFLLFAFHLQNKKLPSLVVIIHGGVAVAAFVSLVVGLYLRAG